MSVSNICYSNKHHTVRKFNYFVQMTTWGVAHIISEHITHSYNLLNVTWTWDTYVPTMSSYCMVGNSNLVLRRFSTNA